MNENDPDESRDYVQVFSGHVPATPRFLNQNPADIKYEKDTHAKSCITVHSHFHLHIHLQIANNSFKQEEETTVDMDHFLAPQGEPISER